MLTTDNSPALVKSAGGQPQTETEARTVVRAFCLAGVRQEVGTVVNLPWKQAREFDAMGKTSPVDAPAAEQAAPITEAPARRRPKQKD